MARAPTQPIPTPSQPFSVIHVDHKGVLPRSGDYQHILVVTCALTRFTLLIPVRNVTAELTLQQLMSRVFAVFGFPLAVVSDNGPAFRNKLSAAMAKFFGYRHMHVLKCICVFWRYM